MADDLRPVLFCFDDSAESRNAIVEAGRLFPRRRAIVLHVWRSLESTAAYRYSAAGVTGALDEEMHELDSAGQQAADDIAERGARFAREAGFDCQSLAVEAVDEAAVTVAEVAGTLDAAVVVMGTRGMGSFQSAVLGGFSRPALRHASRPVLVVPPAGGTAR
jgi:nucleotide-binding universal stress UspA family protein